MPAYSSGRHEHGQNFLTDQRVLDALCSRIATTTGPLVEIGPGGGALTRPLARTGRPLTVVEIDSRLAATLRREFPAVTVVHGDILRHRFPADPHVVVGNIPFHLTTAILRRLLRAPGWTDAILLMQWEVARRRAGVGTTTMMTAQWAPWFTFELGERVPASAFTPRPGVDGGVLHIRRRATPLIDAPSRQPFQHLVHRVYQGKGRGMAEILGRAGVPRARAVLRAAGVAPGALPPQLTTPQWVSIWEQVVS